MRLAVVDCANSTGVIEEAFLRDEEQVKIDTERFITFEKMLQCRIDNPSRFRAVKREGVTRMVLLFLISRNGRAINSGTQGCQEKVCDALL